MTTHNLASFGTCLGPTGNKGGFSNEHEWVKFNVDFASDNTYNVDNRVFTADADLIINDFYADIKTTLVASTSSTLTLGVGSGGTNIWASKTTNSSGSVPAGVFNADNVVGWDSGIQNSVMVRRGQTMILSQGSNTYTAGKMDLWFSIKKRV